MQGGVAAACCGCCVKQQQHWDWCLCLLLLLLLRLQVCVQLKMCPPPSIFSVLNQALGLQTNLLGTKFASFSVITTMPTGIATISSSSSSTVSRDSSSDEGVEEDLLEDTADSGSVVVSSPHDAKQVKVRAKVHGPGLALPMAS